ncbi:MAG: hypothetical protein R2788_13855 [Saprospiraceae bacterium]
MKTTIQLALAFLSLFQIQVLLAQQPNWNIAFNLHADVDSYKQSNDEGINIKFRNKSRAGTSSGFDVLVNRRIISSWFLGASVGKMKSAYHLDLDRDFGDIDEIVGFSEPTVPGDYQNIDQIEYDNKYTRWGVHAYYYVTEKADQTAHLYFGIGYERRNLKKTSQVTSYRDHTTTYFNFFTGESTTENNNRPTYAQSLEAKAYYDDAVAEHPAFFTIKFGIKINTSESFALIVEPAYAVSLKNNHPQFFKSQSGLSFNFMLNGKF